MRRSAYRRAAASSGGNRRMLAVGAVVAALGAVVAFTTISNAATNDKPAGSDAGKVVNGQTILTDTCVDSTLPAHTGFQDGNRCVSTEFGEVAEAANNPGLLITDAPTSVTVNTPFTLKVSTRNLIRDRFLAAGAGGYYVESSVLKDGIERGHFHTECRMLPNTTEAPDSSPVPAFFVATEDSKGGKTPDEVTIQVPGMPTTGTAQCGSWAGDGSHRVPMMQRANQFPAIDAVRVTVKAAGDNGGGNNGGGNTGGNTGNTGGNTGNTGGNTGNTGGNTGNAGGNTGNTGGNTGNTGGNTGNTGGNTGNTGGNNNGGGKGDNGGGKGATTAPTTQPPAQGGNTGNGGTNTGATTKDDFTPGTTAPTTKATTKSTDSHSTKSSTTGSTKTDEPQKSTRTENAQSDNDASDSDTPDVDATTKAPKPKASSSSPAAGNYAYSNEDGVPNSGVKGDDLKNVANPPAAKDSSGPLALTGSNTMAFVGAGAVILLVGLVVLAMTRRRRPTGGNWQQ